MAFTDKLARFHLRTTVLHLVGRLSGASHRLGVGLLAVSYY